MRVLVLHTMPPEECIEGRAACELDLADAAQEITRQLPGAVCMGVRGCAREVLSILDACQPDVVFNLCEAPHGRPGLEAQVAALFEWVGVRFTGSGSETLALCRRKDRTKAVLAAAGLPVPRMGAFPCIVKPVDEDGSVGVDELSVCADDRALNRALARLARPAIVEEFLPGTEFVISIWGHNNPDFVSIGEASFQNGLLLFTYASKWRLDSSDCANSKLDYHTAIESRLRELLVEIARGTWRAVGARGYLRLDVRLDETGHPRVLDVNPNPDVSPGLAMYRAVTEEGWSWERFVRQQVEWA